eukprot:9377877-Alexandrium_andersonii.AAC.1
MAPALLEAHVERRCSRMHQWPKHMVFLGADGHSGPSRREWATIVRSVASSKLGAGWLSSAFPSFTAGILARPRGCKGWGAPRV